MEPRADVNALEGNEKPSSLLENGWFQLIVGVVGMVAITNLQYGWTLFVGPLQARFDWSKEAIQVAFTVFVLAETWLVPIEGYLVDRFGPTRMVFMGGLLVGSAWSLNSVAETLFMFYIAQAIGGVGAGIVYGTCMGNALKWFTHRRGLAVGVTAAAFGAGSALTVWPIKKTIDEYGYQTAFLYFGIAQGIVVLASALLLRAPSTKPVAVAASSHVRQTTRNFTWREMLRTPLFWLMYAIMAMVSTGGMMVTAQIEPMATHFQVANVEIPVLWFTPTALVLAMVLDRTLNGLTRPFFGWISDHLGRENTMFVAFALEGFAILLLIKLAHIPLMFVLMTGLTFFAWGEIYSLFPAICGDMFGKKYATVNYGLLYTAKGTATLLVPLGNVLVKLTGSWWPIFAVIVILDWCGALLALFVLKPMCKRWFAEHANKEDA